MIKQTALAVVLLGIATASMAQAAPAPAPAASAPVKHRLLKRLKNHKPGAPAVNPEASPDKKGGA